jgi:hypothetical protein
MAERAFLRLGHRQENQAILFLYVFPWVFGSGVGMLTHPAVVNLAQGRRPSELTS